jgi:peptidylprolyl isomerase
LLKNGDFIRLEYEGYDDEGNLFDSTKGEVGKTLHGKEGPMLIVMGRHRLIKGLEAAVMGMKKGEEKETVFAPDKAFGIRNKNLIKVMKTSDFARHNLNPEPNLVIHIDTGNGRLFGKIKSVSGGRVMVDFNHPMSSKEVKYKIKLVDVIDVAEGKVQSIMDELDLKWVFRLGGDELTVMMGKPKEDQKTLDANKGALTALLRDFMPEIKKINFKESA